MHIKNIQLLVFVTIATLALYSGVFCSGPPISYKIHVAPSDLSGYDIEMRIQGQGGTIRVAMAAHPEYDDRYWRYIENVSATDTKGRNLQLVREEDPVWRIENAPRDIYVRYRLRVPPQERPIRDSWKPFLTPTGGMVGDLHSLMYVVGETSRSARLTLDMPAGWAAASGLEPTPDPRTFTGSIELMLDAPVMIGKLSEWKFVAGGVPHKIVIWSPPDAEPFDAQPIVSGVRRLADEAIKAFGKPPYPRYTFLFQNGGSAALEHLTSVNIGLSLGLDDLFEEVAHEYIHVWNLMDVKPRERVGIKYRFAEPTGVLWWNEGATIMFADLLIRRAGLIGEHGTRIKHLESAIARYFSSPGYSALSAELVSRGDSHPVLLGDYGASTHLQGEVLSTMLDLKIRDVTDGRRNVAGVMRLLAARFDSDHGIVNADIENAMKQVCVCEMREFFKDHIYGAKQIDFNHYLGFIGLRAEVTWSPAIDAGGKPVVDLRIGPLSTEGELKLRITNPTSTWGKAGLHTGDKLLSVDGTPVSNWSDFREWLRKIKIGDTGRLVIVRDGVTKTLEVPFRVFDVPRVRLVELDNTTPKQLRLRGGWVNAS